jgi:ATP synthase F1 delta subunit
MKNRILIKRYSLGLINAIGDEEEFTEIHNELRNFFELLESSKKLRHILQSPFLPLTKKQSLMDELLIKLSCGPKTARFIGLCVENDRLEFFAEILEYLPELWNEEKGVSTIEVSSVVSLSENQQEKLKKKLELLEKKPVFLKYKRDPSII